MRRVERGDESGFTLIELIIAIVIMGVITVPLANFMLAYFKNYTETESRLSDTHDTQIAAAYFSQDVANTGRRDTANVPTTSLWTAGFPPGYCGTGLGTTVLLLQWDDWTPAGGTGTNTIDSAAYVAISGTLRRVFCTQPVGGSMTTRSSTTVVHNLVYPDSGNLTPVMCRATPTAPATACASSTPAIVDLRLSIKAPADAAVSYVTLSGQRRQSTS
jgi:prepilin-type N-terminal cleavage/methylation domain-containing protein